MTSGGRAWRAAPLRRGEAVLYGIAAAIYFGVGLRVEEVFAWWPYSTAWFLAFVTLVPAAARVVRRRLRHTVDGLRGVEP